MLTTVANIVLKERKIKTFRFYFVVRNDEYRFMSQQELRECILRFVAMSKKNNQQDVINRIKDDLKRFGFKLK